jgi:hypothetical protein
MAKSEIRSAKDSKIPLILLAVLVFSKILLSPLGGLDELWNYNLCRGVAMGYVPYRDFSMVMMPLFTLLFSIPLMVVRKLIVYRITSAVFLYILVRTFHKIAVKMTDTLWGLVASCLFVFFMDIATYNALVVLIILILYKILCREMTRGGAFLAGVLCAFGILSRQTTGVFLAVAVTAIFIKSKAKRKHFATFTGGGALILLCFLLYLVVTDSFFAFWDCCLFALLAPGDKNSAFYPNAIPPVIFCLGGIALDIKSWKKSHKEEDILHLILGAVIITIGIPIVDMMHLCYAAVWFFLPMVKLLHDSPKAQIKPSVVKLLVGLASGAVMLLNLYGLMGTELKNSYREFVLIPSPSGFIDSYNELIVTNDLCKAKGRRVAVYSSSSCVISIMQDEFNPPYDLFLNGNLGTKEPLSFVEADCADPDVVILLPVDYDTENWENPKGVKEYIESHCVPAASYGRFLWYVPS